MAKKKVEVEVEMTQEQKTKAMIKFLKRVHKESFLSEDGYTFTTPAEHEEALLLGFVVVNPEICNDDDTALATVVRESGMDFAGIKYDKEAAPEPEQVEEPVPTERKHNMHPVISAVKTGIELPKCKRGGGRSNPYPFAEMAVDASFFVPNGEKLASKVMAGPVSVANTRGKEAGIKFVCRSLTDGAAFDMPGVAGVMVKRIS
jgi:hypothetical protein